MVGQGKSKQKVKGSKVVKAAQRGLKDCFYLFVYLTHLQDMVDSNSLCLTFPLGYLPGKFL
jgi:hypothetical protein